MREILFRGKRIDNGEWVTGFLDKRPSAVQIGKCSPYFIHVPPVDPDDNGGLYNVDPATVGQYTGLTDKNGKRIFEGDILEFQHMSRYPVFWDQDMAAFGSCYYSDFDLLSKYNPKEILVIGNVVDNPELLGGGSDG